MLILTLRTDNPEAEIGIYDDTTELLYESWHAHRQLAETIHRKIADALEQNKKSWSDVQGIVVYAGPGSFTGLRIGMSVANALAYANQVPIVGASGEGWRTTGIGQLLAGDGHRQVVPDYGATPHITQQRK